MNSFDNRNAFCRQRILDFICMRNKTFVTDMLQKYQIIQHNNEYTSYKNNEEHNSPISDMDLPKYKKDLKQPDFEIEKRVQEKQQVQDQQAYISQKKESGESGLVGYGYQRKFQQY